MSDKRLIEERVGAYNRVKYSLVDRERKIGKDYQKWIDTKFLNGRKG